MSAFACRAPAGCRSARGRSPAWPLSCAASICSAVYSGTPIACDQRSSSDIVFAPMPRPGTLTTRVKLTTSNGLCTSRRYAMMSFTSRRS